MGFVKEIVTGGVVAGAGVALRFIGRFIFSTFGATEGPYVDYRILIDLGSTAIIGLGALIGAFGILHGLYTVWTASRKDDGAEEPPRRAPDRPAPERGGGGRPRRGEWRGDPGQETGRQERRR